MLLILPPDVFVHTYISHPHLGISMETVRNVEEKNPHMCSHYKTYFDGGFFFVCFHT